MLYCIYINQNSWRVYLWKDDKWSKPIGHMSCPVMINNLVMNLTDFFYSVMKCWSENKPDLFNKHYMRHDTMRVFRLCLFYRYTSLFPCTHSVASSWDDLYSTTVSDEKCSLKEEWKCRVLICLTLKLLMYTRGHYATRSRKMSHFSENSNSFFLTQLSHNFKMLHKTSA